MRVTKIVIHVDAALVMDYQKVTAGMSVELEVDPKDDVGKYLKTQFTALRQQVIDEAKAGIIRARKIANKGSK
jgi:hypothetical protein